MKRTLLAAGFAALFVGSAFAQTGPVGQDASGAINLNQYTANTDTTGFNPMSLTASVVVPATATTQALATLIVTKTSVITACSDTTGVRLPAVNRYEPITIINRSGGSCLVFPTIGATVETALGTDGATNAAFTMLTNTDVIFKPISPTKWVQ